MTIAFEISSQRQGRAILAALRHRFRTAGGARARDRRTCFDTFDWRLWKVGAELSGRRESSGWELCWRRTPDDAELREQAASPPAFAWDLSSGRLRGDLEPLIEMRRLMPLVEIEHGSEEVRLLDRRDKTVARLRLEVQSVRPASGGAPRRLPARLVAAPVRGFDRDFAKLLGFLEGEGLERASRPVLEDAYELGGFHPGDYRAKVQIPLEPQLPAHLAMRRIYRQLVDTIRRNEPGLREDLDSEFLHDFRVAIRRTRSALSQVKGVLPIQRVNRFRQEFSWLGGQTGPLRDLDVYLLKLDDYRSSLPPEVAADLAPLEALLRRRQKSEHRRVARALDTQRYRRLLAGWEGFLADEEAPGVPPAGLAPIAVIARDRILKAHARVIKKGRSIGPKTPDAKLHRLRIDCKKLRYLLEFFRDLYDPAQILKVINALKGLQDNLGDFNDLSVQQEALVNFAEELTAERARVAAVLALGQLISNLARRHDEERKRFHKQFERFDRRKVHRRLTRLVEDAAR